MLDGKRILIAEDDAEMLEAISAVLARAGAEVVCAHSGGDLIEQLAHEGPFDLIVTDVSMPWMTGFQVMHSARTAGLSTPIIVITALIDDKLEEKVAALGQDSVLLRKPFALKELEAAATALLFGDTSSVRASE